MYDDFETKREFWYFVGMIFGIGFSIALGFILYITMAMSNDLVERVQEQNAIIEETTNEAVRYKMMYEESYELFQNCLEYGGEYCTE